MPIRVLHCLIDSLNALAMPIFSMYCNESGIISAKALKKWPPFGKAVHARNTIGMMLFSATALSFDKNFL